MKLTLRHKINGAIIVTFLLIAVIFTAIQLPFQQHRFQTAIYSIEILLQTLVERDMEQLANEIFDSRLKALAIRLHQMRKVDGIIGITVFDDTGKILISDGAVFVKQDLSSLLMQKIKRHERVQRVKNQQTTGLIFSGQIDFLGEMLGFIQVEYSLENVEDDQQISYLIFVSLLGSILLVMLVVLNVILSRTILAPVRYLRDATQSIAKGNLEEDFHMSRQDELGILANSFEEMRDAIKEKISDLQRLTTILESTSDLVAISGAGEKIIYMNRAGRKMVGWGEDELLSEKSIQDIYPTWAVTKINRLGIPGAIVDTVWKGETALLGSDGREFPVSQVIMSHENEDGSLGYLSTIIRDISEEKQTEEELRHLRNYLKNVFDSMPSILIGVNLEGKITQWNTEAMRITGITADKAIGSSFVQAFPHLSGEMVRVRKAIQTRELQIDSKRSFQKEGETCYEDVTIYPLTANGVEGVVIRIDDVTERVRMEEMMIQSEKMLSVGGLAAGMAHEINNPLAGMMQSAEVMTNRLTGNFPANDRAAAECGITMGAVRCFMEKRDIPRMLNTIRDSGIRSANIVKSMLDFARKGDAARSSHDLGILFDQAVELANTDYDLKKSYDFRKIKIVREYGEDVPSVPCEAQKIQQVYLNILKNGAQAMQTAETEHSCFVVRTWFEDEHKMVCIEIADNGPGVDEAIRKMMFEPFFTTKPVGVGTGLGLSVSYFIITENHGGTMNVESVVGEGAKFIIRLPIERRRRDD